ncbi:transposase [Xanthomonas sp. WHRI 7945]|nr:transposase [Xanthomonas campestris pv. campestris]
MDDGDRLRYLQLLRDALHHCDCTLHAYVLMDNHVHLLLTPKAHGPSQRFAGIRPAHRSRKASNSTDK